MRRFSILMVLGFLALGAWDTVSAACGRRRCAPCGQPCGMVAYCPAPCVVMPPPLFVGQCQPVPYGIMPTAPLMTGQAQAVTIKPFTSPKGRVYRIQQTRYQDEHEKSQIAPTAEAFTTGDNFRGKDRKASKTSLVSGAPKPFATVNALLDFLPADHDMMHDPGITKAEDSQRVQREQLNVTVPAYLYASSKETDNDFHLILGDADAVSSGRFLNAEVSGLPQGAFVAPLTIPRHAFKDFFGDSLPGAGYDHYDPPIPVTVTGSLFYDIDHAPGVVGPQGHRPQTSWEIHPLSSITFEP